MTGSLTPRTDPTDTITVRCDQCGRVGRYRRGTLLERFAPDVSMPDILNAVTQDCATIDGQVQGGLWGIGPLT